MARVSVLKPEEMTDEQIGSIRKSDQPKAAGPVVRSQSG